jgi:hypothetical protein
MGKLPQGTSCETMNSLAGKLNGKVDFYFWKGIPCFRTWPKKYAGVIAAAQEASYKAFAAIGAMKSDVPPAVREYYRDLVAGSTWTWSDYFTSLAMNYWRATGKIPPAIEEYHVEPGSGLKYFKLKLDRPEQPWLCRRVKRKPLDVIKNYRGKAEACKKPNLSPSYECVPMTLVYAASYAYLPAWQNRKRVGYAEVWSWPPCENSRTLALARYAASPEAYEFMDTALVQQSMNWLSDLGYRVYGRRLHADFLCGDTYSGLPVSIFNGIIYDLETYWSPEWGGAAWSGYVFGHVWQIPSTIPFYAGGISHSLTLTPGKNYFIDVWHPDYYAMPPYPVCSLPINHYNASVRVGNFRFTSGKKWEWEVTLSPPYKKSWWVCFADENGVPMPMYPVSGEPEAPWMDLDWPRV